ncbi:MAG: hypothetical protein IPQ07_34945 [Myxococcales bacterium]|nr:hypothetical protein [Myxococcales bacterium]
MPSRPDLREIASNLKDAFADADRETLLEVLTFVLKEYVVEGPPPMLVHQAETLSDLKGMSFAALISALQIRFEHPELAMLVVDGESVGVRIGGVVQPLLGQRTPLGAAPAPEAPRPQPGVRVVETTMQQRPPAPAPQAQPAQQSSAPPPVRGLSMRGRPTGEDAGAPPAARPPAAAPAAPVATAPVAAPAAPAAPEKPEAAGGDDSSARFSLLELD